MLFKDFVTLSHGGQDGHITLERLVTILDERHHGLGVIDIIPIPFDPPNGQAFFRRVSTDRTSPYDEEFWNIEVCYCQSLDENRLERRYALTKELMHAFDRRDAWASDRETFKRLLHDIQNVPLPEDRGPIFESELSTRWKALVALCPKPKRDAAKAAYVAEQMEEYEVAAMFGVPDWLVTYIMDDYFDTAYNSLMS